MAFDLKDVINGLHVCSVHDDDAEEEITCDDCPFKVMGELCAYTLMEEAATQLEKYSM